MISWTNSLGTMSVGTQVALFHIHCYLRQREINIVRVVRLGPRKTAVVAPQFRVEVEESVTGRLGDTYDLLEEVAEVLDVL